MRRIRLTRADGLFFLLFAAALALALWKVPYGFGWYDEAFYLTIPHRLTLGDALFLDEWHLSQMSGLLLTPFVALYRGLFQCNDGILLAARHFYVALHGLVALFVYLRLRRFGAASVFAAVSFFLFTPFDIMAYSYNTMAIDLLTLCCVGLATMRPGNRPALLLSGAAFAGSVLCCPYLAFVYFLYAALAAVRGIFRRRRRAVPAADGASGDGAFLLSAKAFFFLTLGIALPAALFLLFVFSRASLSELLRVFPALFTDPEHADLSLLSKLSQYLRHCQPYYRYGFAAYGLLLLALLLDKNRMRRRGLYLAGSCRRRPLLALVPRRSDQYPLQCHQHAAGLCGAERLPALPEEAEAAVFCPVFAGLGLYLRGVHVVQCGLLCRIDGVCRPQSGQLSLPRPSARGAERGTRRIFSGSRPAQAAPQPRPAGGLRGSGRTAGASGHRQGQALLL